MPKNWDTDSESYADWNPTGADLLRLDDQTDDCGGCGACETCTEGSVRYVAGGEHVESIGCVPLGKLPA